MGIRVIGQKKFEVTETELLQQDLLFYLDNPRVYSVLHENGHDNPTQTEIEEIMCSLDHVKSLKSQIMQNGGLIEPLIVVKRKDRYVVLEGNSRLAAYRILAKNDPLKWSRVLVQILPEDISDSDCTSQQKLDTNFKYYLSINLISVQYGASFATFLSG